MKTEIIKSKSTWEIIKKEEEKLDDEKLNQALDKAWADESFLAEWLVDIANSAYALTPKWEPYPDYNSRLQALKEIRKIRNNAPDTQINIQNVFWSAWGWL